tara:strand:- start:51 stop:866 length:816 start_codon:yes stop_codon:yes gene_type:complete
MKKIIDCITFFDENMLLDFRLNVLNDYVDFFVIVEAKEDHQGNQKKLNFNIENFKKYKHKIIYLVQEKILTDENIKLPKNWAKDHLRDQSQRNYISKALNQFGENDWIIISDLDEIPNPHAISKFNPNSKFSVFKQKLFYYKFNLVSKNSYWYGSRIVVKKYLKSPQWLRNLKVKKKFLKYFKRGINVIDDGGWHFSYLKKPIDIKRKIESFAHSELNKEKFKNIENIEKSILKGTDLYHRDLFYSKIPINGDFPEYLIENLDKYKDWIVR